MRVWFASKQKQQDEDIDEAVEFGHGRFWAGESSIQFTFHGIIHADRKTTLTSLPVSCRAITQDRNRTSADMGRTHACGIYLHKRRIKLHMLTCQALCYPRIVWLNNYHFSLGPFSALKKKSWELGLVAFWRQEHFPTFFQGTRTGLK